MAKFVGMWEGNKDGYKQESESILIDQLILLAREFKLEFHQYVPIIQQPFMILRCYWSPGPGIAPGHLLGKMSVAKCLELGPAVSTTGSCTWGTRCF